MFEIKDLSVFENQIEEGSHHIRKLVGLYKNNGLDYLGICDLTRKIFRCFDLSNCRELGKIEMKCLLEALSNEMNLINTNLNIQTFQKWFDQIDTDGSQNISLQELIGAFCNIFKVVRPRDKWLTRSKEILPQGLIKKNDEMIRTSLRKFAVTPTVKSEVGEKERREEILRQLWQQYDKNGNGFVNMNEVKHFVQRYVKQQEKLLGEITVTDDEFHQWFREIDAGGQRIVNVVDVADRMNLLIERA